MVREGQQFYYADGSSDVRPDKPGDKIRQAEEQERRDAWLAARVPWLAARNRQRQAHHAKTLHAVLQKRPPRPKRRVRRVDDSVLRQRVLAAIVAWDTDTVTKEDLARRLHVAEHAVEQVFHWLNRKGALSQRRAAYAHDTYRNHMFPGAASGWESDYYSVLDWDQIIALLQQERNG